MTPNEEMKEYVLNLFDDELSWLITSSSKYDETDFESENRNAIQELANTLQSHRTEFLKMFDDKEQLKELLPDDLEIRIEANSNVESEFKSPKWTMYVKGFIEGAKWMRRLIIDNTKK